LLRTINGRVHFVIKLRSSSMDPHLPSESPLVSICQASSSHPRYPFFPSPFWHTMFSVHHSVNRQILATTNSLGRSLLYPLRRNPKNFENLSHYLHNRLLHCICRWNSTVNFKPLEGAFYSCEYVDERIVTCTNISGCLTHLDTRIVGRNGRIY
jgi:hypothetical protein